MNTRLVNLPEILTITQEQFRKIAAANRDLRLEKNSPRKTNYYTTNGR
jgi:hypothetical protein